MTARTPAHPVDDLFVNRWSPRAFDRSAMPEADLKTILEAARWAPSAFNIQPWRFVYAHRGDSNWQTFVDLLNPFNREWGQHASALVYLFSDTEVDGKDGAPNRTNGYHAFDAGSAWTHAALQATKLGYHAHGVAGILKDEIHDRLGVPSRFQPQIALIIGKRGDIADLPESLQARETPSGRMALEDVARSGAWA